jgi:carboxymethylenebutenolidase
MDQNIIDLYDEYTHAPLDRRVFLSRLTALAGSTAAASALLPLLDANYAQAQIVKPDRAPAVIVIHENRGLSPHIEDITRRVALEGFLAFAPDLLSPLGGTPANEDQAREMIGRLDAAQTVDNLVRGVAFLKDRASSTGSVGSIGFCWGGGMSANLATAAPDLNAAVIFYGVAPAAERVPRIKAPMMMHYAGLDERVNATASAFEAALKQAGVDYTIHTYPGVNHAFNNDTAGARYDAAAAQVAWGRTIEFLKVNLKA